MKPETILKSNNKDATLFILVFFFQIVYLINDKFYVNGIIFAHNNNKLQEEERMEGGKERKVKWGILSTGSIANNFVKALKRTNNANVIAVASRVLNKAIEFGDKYHLLITLILLIITFYILFIF